MPLILSVIIVSQLKPRQGAHETKKLHLKVTSQIKCSMKDNQFRLLILDNI